MKIRFFFLFVLAAVLSASAIGQPQIRFRPDEANEKIDVWFDGHLFTSYYFTERSRKVSFYPIVTPSGNFVTRGYPYYPRGFEQVDHPHQIGLTFVFGDVNGVDFWNNSYARRPEDAYKYGSIRHKGVVRMEEGKGQAELVVATEWVDHQGKVLLTEEVTYVFSGNGDTRTIERYGTMTAPADLDVEFTDNLEGLWMIRFDKAFEEPATRPDFHTDAWGYIMPERSIQNEDARGVMRNDRGGEREAEIFSKPTRWLSNSTVRNGERITAVLMDHSGNTGFPGRAFARGYGMMALNNMGTRAYTPTAEPFYHKLPKGESLTFKHKFILVWNRDVSQEEIGNWFNDFCRK